MKDLLPQMLKLSLLCLLLGPFLVVSAPTPMINALKKAVEKGKEKVGSGSGDRDERLHVEPSKKKAASSMIKEKHHIFVAESHKAVQEYGQAYGHSLVNAKKIVEGGYKPAPVAFTMDGGPLPPLKAEALTRPYASVMKNHAKIADKLAEKAQSLDQSIKTYQEGGVVKQTGELVTYKTSLDELKEKYRNPPHRHPTIDGLPFTHPTESQKAEAIKHLDGEIKSVTKIMNRHKKP